MKSRISTIIAAAFLAASCGMVAVAQVPSTAVRALANTTVLTQTALGSNAVFTSGWTDASSTGQKSLEITAYTDHAGSFIIQASNDTVNSNLTTTLGCSPANSTTCSGGTYTVSAATTFASGTVYISQRYWRVVYTNGGTAQTSFELAATAGQMARDTKISIGATPLPVAFSTASPLVVVGNQVPLIKQSFSTTTSQNFTIAGNEICQISLSTFTSASLAVYMDFGGATSLPIWDITTNTWYLNGSFLASGGHGSDILMFQTSGGGTLTIASDGTHSLQGSLSCGYGSMPPLSVVGATTTGNTLIMTSSSATSCTLISGTASPSIVLDNTGPAMTVFFEFYDESSATCTAADGIYGDFATITLGPGQIVHLPQGVKHGLAYKLSGALSSNLVVGW